MTRVSWHSLPIPRAACVLLVVPLLGLTCPFAEKVDCPAGDPNLAIEVIFRDGPTGERLTGQTPGAIQDGAYLDSLRISGYDGNGTPVQMGAGLGQTGTFRLTAKRDGYRAYSQSGIRVTSYTCGVATEFLDVRLERE